MENKVTIKFSYTNEFGDHYSAKSAFTPIEEEEINYLGDTFNNFLRQIGFIRRNDYMLMEDLTEDELEAVGDFLREFRIRGES